MGHIYTPKGVAVIRPAASLSRGWNIHVRYQYLYYCANKLRIIYSTISYMTYTNELQHSITIKSLIAIEILPKFIPNGPIDNK